jgi:hypothetical protein
LDLGGMGRRFKSGIPKEGMDGGQSQVPAACAQTSMLLQVIEKCRDQGGVEDLERQSRRRRV